MTDQVKDEPAAPTTHVGFAHGSKKLDRATIEKAVRRLLDATTRLETKNADGTVTVKTVHETDPPEGFFHHRMKRPGSLPSFVPVEELAVDPTKPSKVVRTYDHELRLGKDDDLDVWCYHLARLLVAEARRVHAKGLSVRSVETTSEGSVMVRSVLVL